MPVSRNISILLCLLLTMDFFLPNLILCYILFPFCKALQLKALFFIYIPFVTSASTYQAGAAWSATLTQLHSRQRRPRTPPSFSPTLGGTLTRPTYIQKLFRKARTPRFRTKVRMTAALTFRLPFPVCCFFISISHH